MGITKRKIHPHIAEKVLERDMYCIICGREGQEIHHCFFGGETNYSETRNNEDQLVLLCCECHLKQAHGTKEGREFCKDYLKAYYGKNWNKKH